MGNFFVFLFYVAGLMVVMYEAWKVQNYDNLREMDRKMKTKEKLNNSESTLAFFMLLYYIWVFVGLFSSQWPLFILLFVLSFINNMVKNSVWSKVDGFLTIVVIILMILNKYHLHYKLRDLL